MENKNTLLYITLFIIFIIVIVIIYIIFKLIKSNSSSSNIIPTDNNTPIDNNTPTDNNLPIDNNTPTDNNVPIDNTPIDNTTTDNNVPIDNTSNEDTTNNSTPVIVDLSFPKSTTSWKQVCYIGNSITFDAFDAFIDTAYNAGITHIILGFMVCVLKNNGNYDNLTYVDTVNSWQNYENSEKIYLLNKINKYGIILMASFICSTSIINMLNSPNYKDSKNLANDLIEWMVSNKIYGIDIYVSELPGGLDETKNYELVNYLGSLSKNIKEIGIDLGLYIYISHAPKPNYFNGPKKNYGTSYWKNIYNTIEELYGKYIDFYNVRYYNIQYLYDNYNTIFINDDNTAGAGKHSSVLQLINANQVNSDYFPIPDFKIVVGKPNNPNEVNTDNGFVKLYSSNSRDTSTLNYYIKQNNFASADKKLQQWFLSGGIMIWKYSTLNNGDLDTTNINNIDTIKLFTDFKK